MKRKQVAIPESNIHSRMSRRSSSLVTVSLDDETSDRSHGATFVIQIGEDDDIDAGDNRLSSSEGMFEVVVDVSQVDGSTMEDNDSSGCCNNTTSGFQTCSNKRINFGCCNRISEFFKRKLEQLNGKLQSKCGHSYLETYFFYANVCGVSPFRFDKNKQPVVFLKKVYVALFQIDSWEIHFYFRQTEHTFPITFKRPAYKSRKEVNTHIFHPYGPETRKNVPYYVVNILAAVDAAALVKYVVLDMTGAHKERSADIRQHLKNCLLVANILLRCGFFVSLQLHPEKFSKMMQTISTSTYSKQLHTIKVLIGSLLICGSSFSLIIIMTNFGLLYGFEDHLIENAKAMRSLSCLQMECPQSATEGLDFITVALGLFGWATNFAGNMCLQVSRDGILFAALTLGKSAMSFRFKRRVQNSTSVDDAIVTGTEILNEYKWITKISKHINSAFSLVFRFFLLANIFMIAVFLDEWFNPRLGKTFKCFQLANILFVCITFYYANQTAKTEERFRDWVRKESNRKILGMSEHDVQMETLSPASIGLGRGAFFIHDSTLIGIASVVAAYYLGIVETRPQDDPKIGVETCWDYFPNITCSILG